MRTRPPPLSCVRGRVGCRRVARAILAKRCSLVRAVTTRKRPAGLRRSRRCRRRGGGGARARAGRAAGDARARGACAHRGGRARRRRGARPHEGIRCQRAGRARSATPVRRPGGGAARTGSGAKGRGAGEASPARQASRGSSCAGAIAEPSHAGRRGARAHSGGSAGRRAGERSRSGVRGEQETGAGAARQVRRGGSRAAGARAGAASSAPRYCCVALAGRGEPLLRGGRRPGAEARGGAERGPRGRRTGDQRVSQGAAVDGARVMDFLPSVWPPQCDRPVGGRRPCRSRGRGLPRGVRPAARGAGARRPRARGASLRVGPPGKRQGRTGPGTAASPFRIDGCPWVPDSPTLPGDDMFSIGESSQMDWRRVADSRDPLSPH